MVCFANSMGFDWDFPVGSRQSTLVLQFVSHPLHCARMTTRELAHHLDELFPRVGVIILFPTKIFAVRDKTLDGEHREFDDSDGAFRPCDPHFLYCPQLKRRNENEGGATTFHLRLLLLGQFIQ